MKAEEYLIRHRLTTNVTYTDGSIKQEEDITLEDARYAVSKARKEERSKALSSLDSALVGLTIKTQDGSNIDLRILKERFRDFINR